MHYGTLHTATVFSKQVFPYVNSCHHVIELTTSLKTLVVSLRKVLTGRSSPLGLDVLTINTPFIQLFPYELGCYGVMFWPRITTLESFQWQPCTHLPFGSVSMSELYPVKSGIANALPLPFLPPSNEHGHCFLPSLHSQGMLATFPSVLRDIPDITHATACLLSSSLPPMPSLSTFPKT